MSVRAKFKVTGFSSGMATTYPHKKEDGTTDYQKAESVEMRSVQLSPVHGNGDPAHENTKFWNATPSGKIELGTINQAAWEKFELDKEYYVDFILAE